MAKYYPNLTKQTIKQPTDLGTWAKSKQDKFKENHALAHHRVAEENQRKYHKCNLGKKIHYFQGKECVLTYHQREAKRQWNSLFKVLKEENSQPIVQW